MKKDKLHNIKSAGFTTPKNYFESFDDKLFERLNKKESIEGLESTGYEIPQSYFDSVEGNVFKRLNIEEKPVISLLSRKTFYYVAGIAASLVLLISIFTNTEVSEELSVEIVETYLEERNLDSYELAQLLADVDLLEEDFTISNTPYDEDNLESYLLDNANLETIIEY